MTDAEREQLRREATLAVLAMAAATVIVLSGGRGFYVIAAMAVACAAWWMGFKDGVRTLRNVQERNEQSDPSEGENAPSHAPAVPK